MTETDILINELRDEVKTLKAEKKELQNLYDGALTDLRKVSRENEKISLTNKRLNHELDHLKRELEIIKEKLDYLKDNDVIYGECIRCNNPLISGVDSGDMCELCKGELT